jgi:hypothetical protein
MKQRQKGNRNEDVEIAGRNEKIQGLISYFTYSSKVGNGTQVQKMKKEKGVTSLEKKIRKIQSKNRKIEYGTGI